MKVIDLQTPKLRDEVLASTEQAADLYRRLGVDYEPLHGQQLNLGH
jgi:hypothetical protein